MRATRNWRDNAACPHADPNLFFSVAAAHEQSDGRNHSGRARRDKRNGHEDMDEPSRPVSYEIGVGGLLGDTLLGAFPGLYARADGTDTVLTGLLPDQAALYGVVPLIESLGLELLELRRTRC